MQPASVTVGPRVVSASKGKLDKAIYEVKYYEIIIRISKVLILEVEKVWFKIKYN